MTTQIPTNPEEAQRLQERLERTYRVLIRAYKRGKSPKLRERLVNSYVRQMDRMLDYKRRLYGER